MSYDIRLYRRETKALEEQYPGDDFFDREDDFIPPFTPAQHEALHQRLLRYGYQVVHQQPGSIQYSKADDDAQALALLTDRGLYFSAGTADFNNVFEIRMTASEFTDTGEFAKYDPQLNGWEEEP